jgi:transcriptional regulator with XRE-family HTH domain
MKIGKAIKEIRKSKGFKQIFIAKQSGITSEHLSRIESDDCNPSIKTILAISNAMDINFAILILNSLEEKDFKEDKQIIYNDFIEMIKGDKKIK